MTRNEYITLTAMLDTAYARYGTRQVLLAAFSAAFFSPKPDLRSLDYLDDRIRQDIGLPPNEPTTHIRDHIR